MTFTESINTCFNKYAVFSGRASPSEFWWFQLFIMLVVIAFAILGGVISEMFFTLGAVFMLGAILPGLGVTVRRLHDTDKSGWWYFISMVPLIGLLLIYFLAVSGTPGDNRFGPAPTS